MNVEYHKWWSEALSQDMELKVYGHAGKPVVVFPCQGGRFYEFEDFGMANACASFIEEGKYQFFTVDSVDSQSWVNWGAHPADRARRHQDYDRYVTQEVIPFIRSRSGDPARKYLATGNSMGAFHAANFFFRHPDAFDMLVAISGLYQLSMFIGDYCDDNVYFNTPLRYLPNLNDPWYLNLYRQSQIVFCSGQGAWEELILGDTLQMKRILEEKGLPCWIDIWGSDVNHDWPWWRKMLPYFLAKLKEEPM